MTESRLEYLFNGYIHNTCTEEEEVELMAFFAQTGNEKEAQRLIDNVIENTGSEMQLPGKVAASILKNILQNGKITEAPIRKRKHVFNMWIRVAAASILFIAGASVYWMVFRKKASLTKGTVATEQSHPILPGGNKAVLTRSDGSTIVLDSIQNGTLVQNGSTTISKQGGLLVYNVSASADRRADIIYNTLTTPYGGQYQVVLSDGSKVWLNAASSLHFPSTFEGDQREVELTGEAYFEVAKNKTRPFLVKVGDMQVKVLGTHFNINAYSDENAIKTSLLEGSVKITKGNASRLLKPGEQGVLEGKEGSSIEITHVNMDEVMAWKKGLFQFEGADITAIMREISRWYNVEIVYDGKVPVRRFEGKISRSARLSEVLQILELSDVKFTLVGNKILVK